MHTYYAFIHGHFYVEQSIQLFYFILWTQPHQLPVESGLFLYSIMLCIQLFCINSMSSLSCFVELTHSLAAGIGIGMLCVSTLVCLYYNVIIAWTFYYLGSSFQSPLPWTCEAMPNAADCGNNTSDNSSERGLSATEVFWK